jgi:hypothetical protein
MLRLLTSESVMGEQTLTLDAAWKVYGKWLNDPRVQFYSEPWNLGGAFKTATAPLGTKPASKETAAALVTFDRSFAAFARKHGCPAILPV